MGEGGGLFALAAGGGPKISRRGGEHCMDEAARATLAGWVRGPSCPGHAPPLLQTLLPSLPSPSPSSPSLNSPTASIDVLPASPSPAQPDSTWERQVKAAGPWEGSSCAPEQRGHSAKPPPEPKRDPGAGAAGRCFPASPPQGKSGGKMRRFLAPKACTGESEIILIPGPCLSSSPPPRRAPNQPQMGTRSSAGREGQLEFEAPNPLPKPEPD